MANNERVTEALDLLTEGLSPYVEQRLKSVYRDDWVRSASGSFRDDRSRSNGNHVDWDAHSLLTVMWDQWNSVFRSELGHYERSMVSELREFRNRWAHQYEFDFNDAYRIHDSVRRLLAAVKAPNAEAVARRQQELIETHVAEEVNTQIQRTAFNRNKLWVIAIYVLCIAFLIWNMLANIDEALEGRTVATALASVLVLTLVYLVYRQFKMEAPLLYGPRECTKCHKIIYRPTCPYCESRSA